MSIRQALLGGALFAACLVPTLPAHATTVALAADGGWNTFDVDELSSQTFGVEWIDAADSLSPDFGSPLDFTFDVAAGFVATLTVVDAGFAGDTFTVTNFGSLLGTTSAVPGAEYDPLVDAQLDFDAALADPSFSRGVFTLGAGSYRISGLLDQSVTLGGVPLNATVGALKLEVSVVPEPSTLVTLLAGLSLLAATAAARRR